MTIRCVFVQIYTNYLTKSYILTYNEMNTNKMEKIYDCDET